MTADELKFLEEESKVPAGVSPRIDGPQLAKLLEERKCLRSALVSLHELGKLTAYEPEDFDEVQAGVKMALRLTGTK